MMTPQQKIKSIIIATILNWEDKECPIITEDNVDDLYYDADEGYGASVQDAKYELREGKVETNIPSPSSRHYESSSVAAQCPDGTWVGWTYWYGGGKHGEPEAIDWIGEAYHLNCVEQEKLVIVREFSPA